MGISGCCPLEQLGQVHRSPAPWPLSQPNGSRFLQETKLSSIKTWASNLFIWIQMSWMIWRSGNSMIDISRLLYNKPNVVFVDSAQFRKAGLCELRGCRQSIGKSNIVCVCVVQSNVVQRHVVLQCMVWYGRYECNVSASYCIIQSPKNNMESTVKSISWDLLVKKTVIFGV